MLYKKGGFVVHWHTQVECSIRKACVACSQVAMNEVAIHAALVAAVERASSVIERQSATQSAAKLY